MSRADTWVEQSDGIFRRMLAGSLTSGIIVMVLLVNTQIPEPARPVVGASDTTVMLRLPEPVLEPKPVIEVIKPKSEPLVVEVPPELPVLPPLVQPVDATPAVKVQSAREKAEVSGLLAFKDQLAALRDRPETRNLAETNTIQRGAGEAKQLDRKLLTSSNTERRAAVNNADLSRETGGVALAGRETTRVAMPDKPVLGGSVGNVRKLPDSGQRSVEEVRRVFDANKSAIFAIYNRALRSNPDLVGKVVLELVIEPDGKVSRCVVVTADLEDQTLLTKIRQRVGLFTFEPKQVAATLIRYPVHFLPG